MANENNGLYEFGPFRLDAGQRLLLRDDCPIPLQPKAFETLLVLVRNSEKVVLKDELLNAVWADTFVQESNLTQNIFLLRKALGDNDSGRRYIITCPAGGTGFQKRSGPSRKKPEEARARRWGSSRPVSSLADAPRGRPVEQGAITEGLVRRSLAGLVDRAGAGRILPTCASTVALSSPTKTRLSWPTCQDHGRPGFRWHHAAGTFHPAGAIAFSEPAF